MDFKHCVMDKQFYGGDGGFIEEFQIIQKPKVSEKAHLGSGQNPKERDTEIRKGKLYGSQKNWIDTTKLHGSLAHSESERDRNSEKENYSISFKEIG